MSPFNYDDNGIEKLGYNLIPDADYLVQIIKAEPGITKTGGDDKVTVAYEIMKGDKRGKLLKNHTVCFFKDRKRKGASMALDFLKAIGEPWQGSFDVDERRWIGKYAIATVGHEEIEIDDKQNGGKKKITVNKVRWLKAYDILQEPATVKAEEKEEEIPF